MAKRLFDFFIYSNLFIAVCVIAMIWQTYHLILHEQPNRDFLYFALFSTLCSYSFHWYLTSHSLIPSPRIAWVNRYRIVHIFLFFLGLAGAAIFFFSLLSYWPWLLFGAIVTFLYSAPKIPSPYFRALRKVAWGKTIFLALVWTFVTTGLPIVISGQDFRTDFFLFTGSRFFLIYAICILFDCRDRDDDKAHGIRSLITSLPPKGIEMLFAFSLLVFAACTLLMLNSGYSFLTVGILLLPGLITAFLFKYSQRDYSDGFYYFVLDGMMALSAFIMLIPGI